MYLLSKFWRLLFGWLAPVLIFVMVLCWYGLDPQTINQSFESRDFYTQLDSELDTAINSIDSNTPKTFSTLLGISVIKQTANPEWLQEVVENNVKLTSKWLTGESSEWVIYMPASDLESAVSENIDESTNQVIAADNSIAACTQEEENAIQSNGYTLDTKLCLPREVIDGSKSFSEFFALDDTVVSSNTLNSLVDNANINTFSDQFVGNDIIQANPIANQIGSVGLNIRAVVVFVRSYSFMFISLIIFLICADLVFSVIVNKKLIHELRKLTIHLGVSLLLLSVSWVMMFGGSAWLSSALWGSIFSGFYTNGLQNLIVSQLAWTAGSMILPVTMLGSLLLVVGLLLVIANRFHIFGSINKKNERINNYQPKGDNETFDGKFKKLLSQKVTGVSTPTAQSYIGNDSAMFEPTTFDPIQGEMAIVPIDQTQTQLIAAEETPEMMRNREIEAARQRLQEQLQFDSQPSFDEFEAGDQTNPFDKQSLSALHTIPEVPDTIEMTQQPMESTMYPEQYNDPFEQNAGIDPDYVDTTEMDTPAPKPLISAGTNTNGARKIHF